MRLNKSTNHAIRILILCARSNGALVKAAELSAQLDITLQNVFKIIHILSRADLVAPVRGPSGGVALARPADQIRMGDIVRAMEATDFETTDARGSNASVSMVLDSALEAFIDVLDRHSLADMARQSDKGAKVRRARKIVRPRSRLKPLTAHSESVTTSRARR